MWLMVSILRYRTAMECLIQIQNIYLLIQNTSIPTGISVGKCYCRKSTLDNELQLLPNTEQHKYTTAPCQKKKKKNKMKPLHLTTNFLYLQEIQETEGYVTQHYGDPVGKLQIVKHSSEQTKHFS